MTLFPRERSGTALFGAETPPGHGEDPSGGDPPGGDPWSGSRAGAGPVIDQGPVRQAWTFNAPKLIVSRMQDHVVETSDGHLHALVNLGGRRGLTLLSSEDAGQSWQRAGEIPDTADSSADIRLVDGEDRLLVVTATGEGSVIYAAYDYDPADGSWSLAVTSEVTGGVDDASTNPTIVMDDGGRLAVACNVETPDGLALVLAWSDDGLTWTRAEPLVDPDVAAGSFRVLSTPDGIGVLAATADAFTFLAYDAGTGEWTSEPVSGTGAAGRFASHFSTTTLGEDIVLASVGEDEVVRVVLYDGGTGTWGAPAAPLGDLAATNVQISAGADGSLHLVADDHDSPGRLVVYESEDGGASWSEEAVLQVPCLLRTEPLPFEIPDLPLVRFEAPEHFDDELVVLTQVNVPGVYGVSGLYSFVIDTVSDTVEDVALL
ncbi:hypothetical protein DLJ53_31850 [Acuticoccus sediminis]|uniref:BNR repeat protein n=1 Tax=Acuticoccus sediminis TaxID=2184697 RepID=A0A8B2NKN4_9HYPH|nr:hypothetical protein [Acuticoccus sediminis]RAH96513.1 hypothetical protein DLJ53_31850 [Acuticoccus sediminis]